MANLYTNENFPMPAVQELRRLGHDCLTVMESSSANVRMSDPEVLAYATAHGRAVVTLNRRHFMALHKLQPAHAGIIVCTVDSDFEALAQHIHEAIAAFPSGLTGRLIRITRAV